MTSSSVIGSPPGASFQLFLGGPNFFFIFQCHRTIEKLEKQHFICSNLTLVIVPFFIFSLFFLFFLFFFLFILFFSFFLFLGGGGGDGPLAPQMTPLQPTWIICFWDAIIHILCTILISKILKEATGSVMT